MHCTTCGGSLVAGARFCSQCGSAIAVEVAAANDPLRGLLEAALGTHYEIRRELGRGGMGAVFLAYERGLDRDVAIKVLPPDRAELEINRQRFRLEARAAARLSHPNIVPLHTFGEHDDTLYYVMGYVEGESLADRLARVGHLGENESRRILASLAEALHYAHSRRVLHRDVKPQNILIEAGSDRPLLTDFGISKVATESPSRTSTGMILGTPEYMSPEQASGSPDVDGRSDLYSLGLVGYTMLSGRLPFQGRTPGELIANRLIADAPLLVCRDPAVSPEMIGTVMKCLAREPAKRWRDGAGFAAALSSDDEAEPELAESVGLAAALAAYVALVSSVTWRLTAQPSVVVELFGKIAPVLALLIATLSVGCAIDLRRRGYMWRHAWQIIVREPASWALWYPAALRRRGNVWTRLPQGARRLRSVMTILAGSGMLVGGLVVFSKVALATSRALEDTIDFIAMGFGVAAVATLIYAWRVSTRLQRVGLGRQEADGVAFAMPLARRGFWSRTSVAALLARSVPGSVPQRSDGATQTVDRSSAPTRVD